MHKLETYWSLTVPDREFSNTGGHCGPSTILNGCQPKDQPIIKLPVKAGRYLRMPLGGSVNWRHNRVDVKRLKF
ncbi:MULTISPECIES: hypothetical protein [Cupriavidus]|jgi:hypothetical protein|uniref:hypothetical protein n=1 Tax=Cupriavidus TaxID=106589 RepID=UPI000CE057E1|nr:MULTISPECIES: hypothetical protein [Cupriavidus]AVA38031.1 hypothetical protein C3Z06_30945 [Cupriavidus metallidurans]QWE98004.1 hypothetical protein KLP38_29360 [Cupriavidus sp. EM10]